MKGIAYAILASLDLLVFSYFLWQKFIDLFGPTSSLRGRRRGTRKMSSLRRSFSFSFPTLLAKLCRSLLRANIKSMRATAGTKEKLSSFRTFFSLDLLPSLFQLCWLNFIDIFFGRTSSLCGQRRAQKKYCQVCAPFFSLDLLPSLFQLCWLNFIDIFFRQTSSLCGRRRAQKKNCQVCAPFYLSISFLLFSNFAGLTL